jgi:hypothetical protein
MPWICFSNHPKHLIAIEAPTSRIGLASRQQILLNELPDLRAFRILAHLQLSGMLVQAPRGHERELDFSELAHRSPPGSRFAV